MCVCVYNCPFVCVKKSLHCFTRRSIVDLLCNSVNPRWRLPWNEYYLTSSSRWHISTGMETIPNLVIDFATIQFHPRIHRPNHEPPYCCIWKERNRTKREIRDNVFFMDRSSMVDGASLFFPFMHDCCLPRQLTVRRAAGRHEQRESGIAGRCIVWNQTVDGRLAFERL